MNIAIIPAKGDSTRIPRKNLRRLNNVPLFLYTLDAALRTPEIDLVVLSTDSNAIKAHGILYAADTLGVQNKLMVVDRPKELTLYDVQVEEVCLHALRILQARDAEIDNVICLQPTSPFRVSRHISEAIDLFPGYGSLFSACLCTGFHWAEGYEIVPVGHDPARRTGTQDEIKNMWKENGAIYIARAKHLSKFRTLRFSPYTIFQMDPTSSLDIDYEEDWKKAERLLGVS